MITARIVVLAIAAAAGGMIDVPVQPAGWNDEPIRQAALTPDDSQHLATETSSVGMRAIHIATLPDRGAGMIGTGHGALRAMTPKWPEGCAT